jgi:hypothetical protein
MHTNIMLAAKAMVLMPTTTTRTGQTDSTVGEDVAPTAMVLVPEGNLVTTEDRQKDDTPQVSVVVTVELLQPL